MRRGRYEMPESAFVSIREAEGWAGERWPGMRVDFQGLDMKIVSASLVLFEYLARGYPNTAGCIKALLRWRPEGDARLAAFAKTVGDASHGVQILFNSYYFGEIKRFLAAAEENVDQGVWPVGAVRTEWPVAHEFGHVALDRLTRSRHLRKIRRLGSMRVDDALGTLAREGVGEGFAQTFAALIISPEEVVRGPYAALVRGIIDQATTERLL